ncbi:MAG: chlorophyll synthase ChlG [Pseudomonadales bacterium]
MHNVATANAATPRTGFWAFLELLKPVTWFPPMWAYACGAISIGSSAAASWPAIAAGVLLAGPLVCGTSQVVNDWFDRHVDAINEPERPIPSGRIPGRWGLYLGMIWTVVSLLVAASLGAIVFTATILGLLLAWAYSAPPARLKLNGWYGNAACGYCYESLPWITGAAVMAAALPDWRILTVAMLYGTGAHGIMTLNDFKALEGDRALGVRTIPVQLGPERAARLACWVMAVPQLGVIGLLALNQLQWHALAIAIVLAAQCLCMPTLLADPRGRAPWYNGTGVTLFVTGMMIAAFGLRTL